jgi:hypothetical protein
MHLSTKGMAIHIHGHPDVLLEFFNKQHRDMVRPPTELTPQVVTDLCLLSAPGDRTRQRCGRDLRRLSPGCIPRRFDASAVAPAILV